MCNYENLLGVQGKRGLELWERGIKIKHIV